MLTRLKPATRAGAMGGVLLFAQLAAAKVVVLRPNETDSLRVGTTFRILWRCHRDSDRTRIQLLRRDCHQQCSRVRSPDGRHTHVRCTTGRCRSIVERSFVVRPGSRGLRCSWGWRIPPDHKQGLFRLVVEPASNSKTKSAQKRGMSDDFLVSDRRINIDKPGANEKIQRSKPFVIRFNVEGDVKDKLRAAVTCADGAEHLIQKGVPASRGRVTWRRPGVVGKRRLDAKCDRIIIRTDDRGLFRVSHPFQLEP